MSDNIFPYRVWDTRYFTIELGTARVERSVCERDCADSTFYPPVNLGGIVRMLTIEAPRADLDPASYLDGPYVAVVLLWRSLIDGTWQSGPVRFLPAAFDGLVEWRDAVASAEALREYVETHYVFTSPVRVAYGERWAIVRDFADSQSLALEFMGHE